MVHLFYRGVAQHGLARLPWEQEVAGSNPVAPIFITLVYNVEHNLSAPDKLLSFQTQSEKDLF
jgi:hypothetical protein